MIGIGDPIEVRFVERGKGELWRAATVTNVDSRYDGREVHVGAAFADGTRMMVHSGQWRAAKKPERAYPLHWLGHGA